MRTYAYKLYNSKKNRHLHSHINVAGCIYNHLIALHKRYYRLFNKSLGVYRLHLHITKLKKLEKYTFWKQLDAQAIQDIAQRIDRAYKLFFRNLKHGIRTSPPGFKKVRKYRSFTLKQTAYKLLDDNKVSILGQIYKYSKSREIRGRIKTLTVKRDALGDLWLFFATDEDCKPVEAKPDNIVGLDFGLKTFLTTSEGEKFESPLFMRQASSRLKKLSQKLSPKKRGSSNRKKARLELAREHRNIANRRKDYHFKLAHELAQAYTHVCVEDLNIKAMQRLWGCKVSDLGHAQFLNVLSWVLSKHGASLIKIDRFYPSSKTCSACHHILPELSLKTREWACPVCGVLHDRDINAAVNISRVGASTLKEEDVRLVSASCL